MASQIDAKTARLPIARGDRVENDDVKDVWDKNEKRFNSYALSSPLPLHPPPLQEDSTGHDLYADADGLSLKETTLRIPRPMPGFREQEHKMSAPQRRR